MSWDSCNFRYFGTANGVKQGGVLSPTLFIVYIDELINTLKASGLGCHVGQHYIGALGYADDITLLSPCVKSLNEMLIVCSKFAKEFNVTLIPRSH